MKKDNKKKLSNFGFVKSIFRVCLVKLCFSGLKITVILMSFSTSIQLELRNLIVIWKKFRTVHNPDASNGLFE